MPMTPPPRPGDVEPEDRAYSPPSGDGPPEHVRPAACIIEYPPGIMTAQVEAGDRFAEFAYYFESDTVRGLWLGRPWNREVIARLAAWPPLAHVTHLILTESWPGDPRALEPLAGSPCAGGLRWMEVREPTPIDPDVLRSLGRGLRDLETLRLRGHRSADEEAAAIAASDWRLRRLLIDGCGKAGAQALAGSEASSRLEDLEINGYVILPHQVGDEGLKTLATSPHLSRLRRLHLVGTGIGAAGAAALARSETLSGLEDLSLTGNRMGADGARALAASRCLRGLRSLCLWACGIGDDGLRALASSPVLATVEDLNLNGCSIGSDGLTALFTSENARSLRRLRLAGNRLDNAGRKIASWEGLARLETLDLADCGIGPAGARALARSRHTDFLCSLVLDYNPVRDGAAALIERFGPRVSLAERESEFD
ncbi:MAG: hypothetical protein HYY17_12650 [Planctomycetes bacterium]|nr:hypothetical protein [Planctomycetota bacterium]